MWFVKRAWRGMVFSLVLVFWPCSGSGHDISHDFNGRLSASVQRILQFGRRSTMTMTKMVVGKGMLVLTEDGTRTAVMGTYN